MMTQSFSNQSVVSQLKMPFESLFCGAEVDTLMQISEAVDMEGLENMEALDSTKEDVLKVPKAIILPPVDTMLKGKLVKDRKPRNNFTGRLIISCQGDERRDRGNTEEQLLLLQ